MRYTIRPLDASTWAAFAELVERNNGIFGGCWCMGYHPEESRTDAAQNRAGKERRVREGRAHASLVIDEDGSVQGWCQYGSPEELPGIKHRRDYDKTAPPSPDWRITCFFVDKKHRGQGIARAALEGARPDRPSRRRACRGDLRGDRRPQGAGALPVQRDSQAFRADRLHPRPPGRQAHLDREQGDPADLSIRCHGQCPRCS
jgi:GNAT superfamily N-acetyltransferase